MSRSSHQPLRVGSGTDEENGRRQTTLAVAPSKPPPPRIWSQSHTVAKTARSSILEPLTEPDASSKSPEQSAIPLPGNSRPPLQKGRRHRRMEPKRRTSRRHLSTKPKRRTPNPHTLQSRSHGSSPTEKERGEPYFQDGIRLRRCRFPKKT